MNLDRLEEIAELRARDLKRLMGSPEGRRTVWWLIDEVCATHSGSFSPEALRMAYAEGARSVGISIIRHLQKHCPDAYVEMLSEVVSERKHAALADESAKSDT